MSETPPFETGQVDLPDDIYNALDPLDGFPKGSRGGPRIYRYEKWWVSVSLSDFGDLLVGSWGEMAEQNGPKCICVHFRDTGGYRIADLTCPVHGVDGTHPGDGYWDDDDASIDGSFG